MSRDWWSKGSVFLSTHFWLPCGWRERDMDCSSPTHNPNLLRTSTSKPPSVREQRAEATLRARQEREDIQIEYNIPQLVLPDFMTQN